MRDHSREVALRKIAELCDARAVIRWMREKNVLPDPNEKLTYALYARMVESGEVARNALGIELPACPKCGNTNDCEKHGFVYDAARPTVEPGERKG